MTLTEALHRIRAGLRSGEYIHDPGTTLESYPWHQIRTNEEHGFILGEGTTEPSAVLEAAEWLMLDANAKDENQ